MKHLEEQSDYKYFLSSAHFVQDIRRGIYIHNYPTICWGLCCSMHTAFISVILIINTIILEYSIAKTNKLGLSRESEIV